MAQMVKSLPAMWETRVRSLGWEDPLDEEMATHSSILFFFLPIPVFLSAESPWIEGPGGLQSMGLQRTGHN